MKILTALPFFAAVLAAFNANGQTVIWSKKSNSVNGLATYGVAFSSNGEKVLSGSECHPANIRMFDVTTGNLEWNYNVGTDFMCIQGVKFSSNGTLIASVEELGNILVFNNSGPVPTIYDTIITGTSYAFSADFAPDNNRMAVGASSGRMIIYNVPGGTTYKTVVAHSPYVWSVAYSPDGMYIASGGADNKAKIWTADGTLKFTLNGHANDVSSVKFTKDNQFLVTGDRNGKVKIWNVLNGSLVRTINAHNNEIKQLDVSPDGSRIVTASSDGTCKIWNFQTGGFLNTFSTPGGGEVWTVAWSNDGGKIVTGNANGDVILWDVSGITSDFEADNIFKNSKIYPNPATDWIHLQLDDQITISTIEIQDIQGRRIRQLAPSTRTISTDGIPDGIYLLKLTTETGHSALLKWLKISD